jgi:hypothetical protein
MGFFIKRSYVQCGATILCGRRSAPPKPRTRQADTDQGSERAAVSGQTGAKPGYIIVGVKWKYKIMILFGRTLAPVSFVARSKEPCQTDLKKMAP